MEINIIYPPPIHMYTKHINKINNKQLKQTYGEFSFDLKPNVIYLPLFF